MQTALHILPQKGLHSSGRADFVNSTWLLYTQKKVA